MTYTTPYRAQTISKSVWANEGRRLSSMATESLPMSLMRRQLKQLDPF